MCASGCALMQICDVILLKVKKKKQPTTNAPVIRSWCYLKSPLQIWNHAGSDLAPVKADNYWWSQELMPFLPAVSKQKIDGLLLILPLTLLTLLFMQRFTEVAARLFVGSALPLQTLQQVNFLVI